MITFKTAPNQAARGGQLVYRRDEYAFDTESEPAGGRGISVVVNEVELFIDDEARVIYVSGYCPYQGWEQTALSPPAYSRAGLIVIDLEPKSIEKGMAFGVNDSSRDRWPVAINPEGWVCIGEPADHGDQAVEFAPNCVAVLKGESLVALWLRPCDR